MEVISPPPQTRNEEDSEEEDAIIEPIQHIEGDLELYTPVYYKEEDEEEPQSKQWTFLDVLWGALGGFAAGLIGGVSLSSYLNNLEEQQLLAQHQAHLMQQGKLAREEAMESPWGSKHSAEQALQAQLSPPLQVPEAATQP